MESYGGRMRKDTDRFCFYCGKDINVTNARTIYCSDECKNMSNRDFKTLKTYRTKIKKGYIFSDIIKKTKNIKILEDLEHKMLQKSMINQGI